MEFNMILVSEPQGYSLPNFEERHSSLKKRDSWEEIVPFPHLDIINMSAPFFCYLVTLKEVNQRMRQLCLREYSREKGTLMQSLYWISQPISRFIWHAGPSFFKSAELCFSAPWNLKHSHYYKPSQMSFNIIREVSKIDINGPV